MHNFKKKVNVLDGYFQLGSQQFAMQQGHTEECATQNLSIHLCILTGIFVIYAIKNRLIHIETKTVSISLCSSSSLTGLP